MGSSPFNHFLNFYDHARELIVLNHEKKFKKRIKMGEEKPVTNNDDLGVEKDLWWTALVVLLCTGKPPEETKTRIKRKDQKN